TRAAPPRADLRLLVRPLPRRDRLPPRQGGPAAVALEGAVHGERDRLGGGGGRLPRDRPEGRPPGQGRRYRDAHRQAGRARAPAGLPRAEADGVERPVPRGGRRLFRAAGGARPAEAERRGAGLRARDLAGARLRVPMRVPRPAPHGHRQGTAGAGVRARADRDRPQRRVPRDPRRRDDRCAQPERDASAWDLRPRRGARRARDDHHAGRVPRTRPRALPVAARRAPGPAIPLAGACRGPLQAAARRDHLRLLRPAEVQDTWVRLARLRADRLRARRSRPGRRAPARRARRRVLERCAPGEGRAVRTPDGRAPARADPATAVRRGDPGFDRLAHRRARDGEGQAQGRARQVLRRGHHPQAKAARAAEEGEGPDAACGPCGRAAGGVHRRAQGRSEGGGEEMSTGMYVHVPFCLTRCGYCDFNAYAGLDHLASRYVSALLREAGLAAPGWSSDQIASVFLGGGTPTTLEVAELKALLVCLRHDYAFAPDAEVTIEANPDTVDLPKLEGLLEGGFARLSMGAQSFDPLVLASLERLHDPASVRRAMREARAAGYANVNLDLIYGADGERIESWERTLRETVDLAPEHVSAYALTIEPSTPLGRKVQQGAVPPPDPDLQADMFELACELLGD